MTDRLKPEKHEIGHRDINIPQNEVSPLASILQDHRDQRAQWQLMIQHPSPLAEGAVDCQPPCQHGIFPQLSYLQDIQGKSCQWHIV